MSDSILSEMQQGQIYVYIFIELFINLTEVVFLALTMTEINHSYLLNRLQAECKSEESSKYFFGHDIFY